MRGGGGGGARKKWKTLSSNVVKRKVIVLNVHLGRQQKRFLPFGHGRDLAAFKGTGLQTKSFQDRAEISKALILSVLDNYPC